MFPISPPTAGTKAWIDADSRPTKVGQTDPGNDIIVFAAARLRDHLCFYTSQLSFYGILC